MYFFDKKRNDSQKSWHFYLMYLQSVIIIILFCVWKWETIWPWIKGHTDSTLVVTILATVIGALIVRWGINFVTYLRFETREYITFEADFTQVFRLSKKVSNLEYSVGKEKWKELKEKNIPFGGNRGKLMLRGRNKNGTEGAYITFATDEQVICTGDIRTLVDYKHYDHADTKEAVFDFLFSGCRQLVVAPELPATELAVSCYSYMFFGCTSLKTAPELPATKLASMCYDSMFYGCTSLITPPKLIATELAFLCYSNMFHGCTSLSNIIMLAADTKIKYLDNPGIFDHWLENTSPKGTFYKNKNAKWNNKGIVPNGWKVELIDLE